MFGISIDELLIALRCILLMAIAFDLVMAYSNVLNGLKPDLSASVQAVIGHLTRAIVLLIVVAATGGIWIIPAIEPTSLVLVPSLAVAAVCVLLDLCCAGDYLASRSEHVMVVPHILRAAAVAQPAYVLVMGMMLVK